MITLQKHIGLGLCFREAEELKRNKNFREAELKKQFYFLVTKNEYTKQGKQMVHVEYYKDNKKIARAIIKGSDEYTTNVRCLFDSLCLFSSRLTDIVSFSKYFNIFRGIED